MAYEDDFASLLARRASGEITADEFRTLRNDLVATAPKPKPTASYVPKLPGSRYVQTKRHTVVSVFMVIVTCASVGTGLWIGGLFKFQPTPAQWLADSRSNVSATLADSHALIFIPKSQREAQSRGFLRLENDYRTLAMSNCPNTALRDDVTNLTNITAAVATDYATATSALTGHNLGRDLTNFFHQSLLFISDLHAFSAVTPRQTGVGGTTSTITTTTSINYTARAACEADAQVVLTAVSSYDGTYNPILGRESGITIGRPSTYAMGHFAHLLVRNGLLRNWPSVTNGYAISLSTTQPGAVLVYVPANSTQPINFADQTALNGCHSSSL